MESRTVAQVIVYIVILAIALLAVAQIADGWADWVVFGVLVMTVYGAAIAVHQRRYTTKKRTFVRNWDDRP
jgi:O-antigen/teichoic acid export membrane protein